MKDTIAEAISRVLEQNGGPPWGAASKDIKQLWRDQADAATKAVIEDIRAWAFDKDCGVTLANILDAYEKETG